jgi:hypothetical protein
MRHGIGGEDGKPSGDAEKSEEDAPNGGENVEAVPRHNNRGGKRRLVNLHDQSSK